MKRSPFTITLADWHRDSKALKQIRSEVFIREQSVPSELEWDGLDKDALHLLACSEGGEPIATARLLGDGHIGRVAVLKGWRKRGIGTALIEEMISQAQRLGYEKLELAAQSHALSFYERFGFMVHGAEFMDAGIPHRHMSLDMRSRLG